MVVVLTDAPPSVSSVLTDVYGLEFERASQSDRLVLMEAIAFSLRVGDEFNENLSLMGTPSHMPAAIYTSAKLERNEGLKLLAVLQVAIVEGYAALAFIK